MPRLLGLRFRRQHSLQRTEYLERRGVRVPRFWNNEVLQETESMLEKIYLTLEPSVPSSPALLPPAGEGGA